MEKVREVFTRIGSVGIGKESPRLSALLNLGSPGGKTEEDAQEDILDQLPETREFLDSLPYRVIDETEEINSEKATEAMRLTNRVEHLISDQERAVEDFKHQLSQLSEMTKSLQEAEKFATSLHKQLLDLSHHVASYEKQIEQEELEELRRREQASLEAYKLEKRQSLEQMRQEYANKLDEFHRERIDIIGQELGEGIRRPSSVSSMKQKRRSAAATLETVTIEHEGIDDFFGDKPENPPKRPGTANPAGSSSTTTKGRKPAARRAMVMADEDLDDDLGDLYGTTSKSKGNKKA